MVAKVNRWEADDGTTWDTEREALEQECRVRLVNFGAAKDGDYVQRLNKLLVDAGAIVEILMPLAAYDTSGKGGLTLGYGPDGAPGFKKDHVEAPRPAFLGPGE